MEGNWVLGDRIKETRLKKRISLNMLSTKTGIDKSTISRYENNEIKNISYSKLYAIAQALEVSPDYLIGSSDNNEEAIYLQKDRLRDEQYQMDLEAENQKVRNMLIETWTNMFKEIQVLITYLVENEFTVNEIKEIKKYAEFIISRDTK